MTISCIKMFNAKSFLYAVEAWAIFSPYYPRCDAARSPFCLMLCQFLPFQVTADIYNIQGRLYGPGSSQEESRNEAAEFRFCRRRSQQRRLCLCSSSWQHVTLIMRQAWLTLPPCLAAGCTSYDSSLTRAH